MDVSNALSLAASAAFALVFVSFRRPYALRNIFLAYVFAIYNLAPFVFLSADDQRTWRLEYVGVVLAFAIGHGVGAYRSRGKATRRIPSHANAVRVANVRVVLLVALIVNALILLMNVASYGVIGFYSGASLVAAIQGYGKADARGAIIQVLSFVASTAATVLFAVYIEQASTVVTDRVLAPTKDSRRMMRMALYWLVIFPILQFSRSLALFGVFAYAALRQQIARAPRKATTIALIAVALAFFGFVGKSRARGLDQQIQLTGLFASELSPWVAYASIKTNIGELGYQKGKTLFVPFLFKVVPRGVFPTKPYNSSAYLMRAIFPGQLENGFVLAPTYMGDLYLNFGIAGVLLGTVILGIFSGAVDGIVVHGRREHLGVFVLVFLSYFTLLRNNISDTLFVLAVQYGMYRVIRLWATGRLNI